MRNNHIVRCKARFTQVVAFGLVFLFMLSSVPTRAFADESVSLTPPVSAAAPAPAVEDSGHEPQGTPTFELPGETEEISAPVETDSVSPNQEDELPGKESIKEEESSGEKKEEESAQSLQQESGTNSGGNSSSIKQILPQADQSTGAMTFSYPIMVPPGRNGLQPDVSLTYNSMTNDSSNVFGNGWSISIPSIERINRKGIDKLYTENYFQSSLDGELVSAGLGNYAPKIENGNFLTYSLSSNVWTVKDKKGTIYKFGNTANSRQDNSADTSKVFKWMLEEVRDRNDNFIKYEYFKDAGQIYPNKIKYTGIGTTDGIFEVEFLRESRADAIPKTNPGFSVATSYRVYEVQVKINSGWVRKYALAYVAGDNTVRSVLNTITETGKDESGNAVSLPATDFDYQAATTSGSGFTGDTGWSCPSIDTQVGVYFADINGDGYPDILESYKNYSNQQIKNAYISNGSTGWSLDSNYAPPILFYDQNSTPHDLGVRIGDLNGDGKADLIRGFPGQETAYINNGSGWTQNNAWSPGISFSNGNNDVDTGARLADINGDGLVDLLQTTGSGSITTLVHLNNGNGWTSDTSWTAPVFIQNGVALGDYNSDGLIDMMQSYEASGITTKATYFNNGNKSWTANTSLEPPTVFFSQSQGDYGVREADINGDGLSDLIQGYGAAGGIQRHFINKGNDWTEGSTWAPGIFIDANGNSTGLQLADINGDGMIDQIDCAGGNTSFVKNVKTKGDLLSKVTYSRGGNSVLTYKATPLYKNGSTLLNPSLPFVMDTLYKIDNNDGFGTISTNTFGYEGGKYYYVDAYDRKLSGFNKISNTNSANNKTINFYHQGDSSDSSNGEYSDHTSKIGKIYRTEILDGSANLYAKSISKWDKYNLGTGRDFVKRVQTVDFSYDGDSDHREKAESYTYENTYGNLTEQVSWGEVSGANDGTFTDTGSDKFTTTVSYATNTTYYVVGLPSVETRVNQSAVKVDESRYYYDTSALGSVTKGNVTKQERWKSGSTYIDVEKTYNSYGLITTEKDPRDKTTTYSYDSYNLYPASVTNPLSQTISYVYDYSLGKPKQVTDVNGRVFQTVFDGLDRVVEEKQPDLTIPSTLVTKTTYSYTSQGVGNKIQKTNYLDSTTTAETFTYTDGFDRPIQTRREMEDNDIFAVSDIVYNNIEQVYKESLPYSQSGSGKTGATNTASLYTTYSYDPMVRVASVTNAVGTTTMAYDDWKQSTTNARGKNKNVYTDAYGNLVKVEEFNSGATYTTNYEYDGNGNLTKITDALGNIRNFTYDGLSRRLTAQDLHASGDATFGTWTYTYDDSGNLTQTVDPKSQTINFTYDDINRQLTENYTGQTGTEALYTYDTCTNGVGRICQSEVVGTTLSQYQYNALGLQSQEYENTSSQGFTSTYTYDRQGNQLEVTNPDGSKIKYGYNSAGELEIVQRKETTDGSFINVVTDFDYGPHGKLVYQANANGVNTTNTYDAAKSYRLERKQSSSTSGGGSTTTYTTTFYPASSADGQLRQTYSSGSGVSWGTIVAGGGVSVDHSNESLEVGFSSDTGSNKFQILRRGILMFDTSSLPDTATITSATLSVRGTVKYDNLGVTPDLNIYSAAPASNSTLAVGDFDSLGSTAFSSAISYASFSTSGYNNFSLNSAGLGNISKTSVSPFGVRNANYDVSGTQPAWSSSTYSQMHFYTVDVNDQALSPKLVVTYDVTTPGASVDIQDSAYTYDAGGNITQVVDSSDTNSAKTVAYTYDDLDRLLSATATGVASGQSAYTESYTYDAIGNILTKTANGTTQTYTYAGNQGASYANPHAVTSIGTGGGSGITFDASSVTSEVNNTTSVTLSHTTGTLTNGLIVVGLQIRNGANGSFASASSCTYNGVSLTLAKAQNGSSSTGRYVRAEEWYGVNPASGAHNVVCNFPSSASMVIMGASTYAGVAQTSPVDVTASNSNENSDTPSVSITTGVNNALVVDTMMGVFNSSLNVGSGQTQLWQGTLNGGGDYVGSSRKVASSAGSTTMSWFCPGGPDEWTSVAASFKPASAGSATNYTYDNNGNLTGDGIWTNTWNYNNRLAQSAKTGTTVTYGYDTSGSRVRLANGSVVILVPSGSYSKEGSLDVKYISGASDMIGTIKGTGASAVAYAMHTDHLSSSSAITNSVGTIVELSDYFPYGNVRLNEKQSGFDDRKGYIGKDQDPDTGLSYLEARYYNGTMGRFISQDPVFWNFEGDFLSDPQLQNSYSYGRNNPLAYNDPDGQKPTWAGVGRTLSNGLNYAAGVTRSFPHIPITGPIIGPKTPTDLMLNYASREVIAGTFSDAARIVSPDTTRNDKMIAGAFLATNFIPGGKGVKAVGKVDDVAKTGKYITKIDDVIPTLRQNHILNGDVTGGGHAFGAGKGKPEFPKDWSPQQIFHNGLDIATDPGLKWKYQPSKNTYIVSGIRDGVNMSSIIDRTKSFLITIFPNIK